MFFLSNNLISISGLIIINYIEIVDSSAQYGRKKTKQRIVEIVFWNTNSMPSNPRPLENKIQQWAFLLFEQNGFKKEKTLCHICFHKTKILTNINKEIGAICIWKK